MKLTLVGEVNHVGNGKEPEVLDHSFKPEHTYSGVMTTFAILCPVSIYR